MSLINTAIKPFKATAYQAGEFIPVTDATLKGKWSVVFFYPADFTFVCPTELGDLAGLRLLPPPADATPNHSYFPVLVGHGFGLARDALYQRLKDHGIHARRYFHPLISDFPMYRGLPSADPSRLPFRTEYYRRLRELSAKNVESIIFDQMLPHIAHYWTKRDMERLAARLDGGELFLEFVQGNSWHARITKRA